jgi:DNA-binding response OmpR family regulator
MKSPEALILRVDPDAEASRDLEALLQGEGYRVTTTTDGTDALKYVGGKGVGCAFLVCSGVTERELGLVGALYAASPTTRIVLLARQGDWSEYLKVLDRGGDDLLTLPLKPSDLFPAVARRTKAPWVSPASSRPEVSHRPGYC